MKKSEVSIGTQVSVYTISREENHIHASESFYLCAKSRIDPYLATTHCEKNRPGTAGILQLFHIILIKGQEPSINPKKKA